MYMLQVPEARLAFLDGAFDPDGSPAVDNPKDVWKMDDSGFDDYCERSRIDGVADLIVSQLGRFGTNAALELAAGANARALQDLLERGVIDKGLATSFADTRSDETKAVEALSHRTGDLLEKEVWREILGWQAAEAPEGLSLILYRPWGALNHIQPTTAYQGAAHLLLDILRPGGVFFAQIPGALKPYSWTGTLAERVCTSIRQRPDVGRVEATENSASLFSAVAIVKA